MACYLPDHLVRCLICRDLFSDARRLRCGCVYCYSCCLKLVNNSTLSCLCAMVHRFKSPDELEKALVVDSVVNDLVRQHIKQKQTTSAKLVDYDETSIPSPVTVAENDLRDHQTTISASSSTILSTRRKQVAVAQPPCAICKKKSHMIILCEHCKCDICELCIEPHYQLITDVLHDRWKQCKDKFNQINDHVLLSHQNKAGAISKLDAIRRTIEERSQHLKTTIDHHRQTLAKHLDSHVQNLEHMIKTNGVNSEYQLIRERLPKILEEDTTVSDLVPFLGEADALLQRLILRDEQLRQVGMKIPYLSPSDTMAINVSHLLGELKLNDPPTASTERPVMFADKMKSNENDVSSLMSITTERTRFPRRMRPPMRGRGGRGIQHLSHLIGPVPRNNNYPRNNRSNGNYYPRGRASPHPRVASVQHPENNLEHVPNSRYQWSIDFREVPYFLAVLDNRNRARQPDARPHHKHDHMLFIADDYGRLGVYSLPKSRSPTQPSIIGTGELFPKNSRLLLESFTVYEFAIIVYIRRFEQRSNEIEHSKLIKAGLPIMKGEQGRCNDHGGMIYLFSHGGDEIDGVYQPHPIRVILADQIYGRLWALNPMQNNVYTYIAPNSNDEIRKCLQEEEIILDFSDESFEPSTMIQSDQSIGLLDVDRDAYRLYSKDDKLRLITTYENSHPQQWKLSGGVIFKDNRTLLKLTEDKYYGTHSDERLQRNRLHSHPRCRLIELTPDGQEKRQIQAGMLYSMTLGPDDEIILGFAGRSDRGIIHCY